MLTLCALPTEVLHLISGQIRDRGSLFSLVLVSKRFYILFNRCLYELVDLDQQVLTLSLSERDRLPLTRPHPASFVKDLELIFCPPEDSDDSDSEQEDGKHDEEMARPRLDGATLRKMASSAVENIINHQAAVRRLVFSSQGIALPQVFENTQLTKFNFLRELVVSCPLPKAHLEHGIATLVRPVSHLYSSDQFLILLVLIGVVMSEFCHKFDILGARLGWVRNAP